MQTFWFGRIYLYAQVLTCVDMPTAFYAKVNYVLPVATLGTMSLTKLMGRYNSVPSNMIIDLLLATVHYININSYKKKNYQYRNKNQGFGLL